jgi:dCTP deaminase
MLLSDVEIRAEIAAGRLVFAPELAPGAIQSASIDMSLSRRFWRPKLPEGPGIDIAISIDEATAYQYFEEFEADQVDMEPGEFLLGETHEGMTIPQHLAAWIEGKSGRARHGLIVHCTAPHIAPGWGTAKPKSVTLELVNHSKAKLRLKARTAIAQLLVTRLGLPSAVLYADATPTS